MGQPVEKRTGYPIEFVRLVASTLLVLLIAGWLVHLVGVEQTWRLPRDFPILTASRHA
jgi:putative effector of murein hydrolase LrgA (UPF0299 family)